MENLHQFIEKQIREEYLTILREKSPENPEIPEGGDFDLLSFGMDSLGMAILVVRLEEVLGYDPFVLHTEPVYPRRMGEFVAIYLCHAEHLRQPFRSH